ncbi:alpha/beta-Hydrolases superfamily protein [Zea mays]|jgi:hypothetical protein|nr:alpha/beta-Hydrolases superfamily protein [Zea mays]AQK68232.1 alpha/beta-Hydrolases superfamily protein [Zea mays]
MAAAPARHLAAAFTAAAAHQRVAFRRVQVRAPVSASLSFPPRHPATFRGRASLACPAAASLSVPSGAAPPGSVPFNLLPPDSDPFIEWDPPPGDSAPSPLAGGGAAGGATLVVLLGWLGARQKHLRRYADLYRERGVGAVRFVVPVRELVGLDLGRRVERRVADLSEQVAAWCDADRRRTLLFHTFSNTGWLA